MATESVLNEALAHLVLCEIAYNDVTLYRLANNTEDVVHDDVTWTAAAFTLSPVREALKGDLPRLTLTIWDPDNAYRDSLSDNYGWTQGEITLSRVKFADAATPTDTGVAQTFTVLDTTIDSAENTITLSLGINDPLTRRFPRDRYVASICRHRFRGGMCRFSAETDFGDITTSHASFVHDATDLDRIVLAPGAAQTRFRAGMLVEVTGSLLNDNLYEIDNVTIVAGSGTHLNLSDAYRVVDEGQGATVTVSARCDHTITRCRANSNSHKYGGSPGIAEGLYG